MTFSDVTVLRGSVSALERVTARVPFGSCTAVIGPNGAGKTTLLLTLLGELTFQGHIGLCPDANGNQARIGYVPQQLHFDRGMPLTVLEFLAMGMQSRPLYFGVSTSVKTRAHALLNAVQADYLANRRLGALSGGETQRVLLALALAQEPNLLVLDEPAAGVDPQGEFLFCELLEELRKKNGFTQLMVSHDLGMVTHHATHVICLNHTVIVEGPPREVLTSANLMRLFGMHMGLVDAQAMPESSAACTQSCCTGDSHE